MADILRLVVLQVARRPVVIRDYQDINTYFRVRDSFKHVAPARKPDQVNYGQRYGGQQTVGESHDNASIQFSTVVQGVNSDAGIVGVEQLIADLERYAPQVLHVEFRPHGGTYSTFYEIRGPATWNWNYNQPQFAGTTLSVVDLTIPSAPLALMAQMDLTDDFSVDSIADYRFDAMTSASITITNGQVVGAGTLNTERRFVRTVDGYLNTDVQDTAECVVGTTLSAFQAGIVMHASDPGTYIAVYVDDNGTNSTLKTDKYVAGVRTNLQSQTLARLTTGQRFWVRGRIEGDIVDAEYYLTPPTPTSTPTFATSVVQALAPGLSGMLFRPVTAGSSINYYEHLPYTYASANLPETLRLPGIPGTADSLADIVVTNAGTNYATNPGFELNANSWSVTAKTGVMIAGTSITRTANGYLSGFRGDVVTPGVAPAEGASLTMGTRVFRAGQRYYFRAQLQSVSGTTLITAKLMDVPSLDGVVVNTTIAVSGWTMIEGSWIPSADRSGVIFAVMTSATSAATFMVDAVEITGPDDAPAWALMSWGRRPDSWNFCWNGDFEENVQGWSTATVTGVQAAAGASISQDVTLARVKYGLANARIAFSATIGAGVNFKIYRRFKAGVTYTAILWASSAGNGTTMILRLGVNGSQSDSPAAGLTTTPTLYQVSWTPSVDVENAYISFQSTVATSTICNIDGVCVYEGTTPPVGRQLEGAGAPPPFGIIEAESADTGDVSSTWAITDSAIYRMGSAIIDSSNSGLENYAAGWWLDPSLVVPDDFSRGEVDIEFWADWELHGSNVNPRATLSARPEWGGVFGAERFTSEYGVGGKALVEPATFFTSVRRPVRLGTITFPVDPCRPGRWKLFVSASTVAGSAGTFGIDFLYAVPIRRRVSGQTGKANDADYPRFMATSVEMTRIITSDLRGLAAKPPYVAQPTAGALGGPPIELPPGDVQLLAAMSSHVPDDPTGPGAQETAFFSSTVHVAVTPRVYLLRGEQ